MPFVDVAELRPFVEWIRDHPNDRLRKLRLVHCGNCDRKQEHAYLWFRDVPSELVSTRICVVCGFAPGSNQGVKDKQLRQQVLEADNHECVYCGTSEHLVLDHIIPHSHGGAAVFENLRTACRSCNSRRNTKRTPVLRFGRYRKH